MKKKEMLLITGIILIFIGTLLPSIRIAQENISFLKEKGSLIIILLAIMFILYKLNKETLIIIPSMVTLYTILSFIFENTRRLHQINQIYNCYAKFKYGLFVMIIGDILVLIYVLTVSIKLKEILEKAKSSNKVITKEKIEKLVKKEKKQEFTHEKTKDGKISYNKLVIKCDNKKTKKLLEFIDNIKLKFRLKRISRKKLSISRFKEDYERTPQQKIYKVPVIDIRKWTRSSICCINCGATVSSNSEYCFLCDCKIKLHENSQTIH